MADVIRQILLDELCQGLNDETTDYLDVTAISMPILETAFNVRRTPVLGTGRIDNYVEETVPRYSDPMFRAHFRMSRTTFEELLQIIGPSMPGIKAAPLDRRTLACIWYMGNTETFRSVSDRFGISKGTLHYFISNFSQAMTNHHTLQQLISWPRSELQYRNIADKFSQNAGFPNTVGAIDGTYIQIPGPTAFRDSYICRKGFPAMHLQAVCDSNLCFLDVFSAYPGSVHDSRVFRNSPLYGELERNPLPEKYHLLGDSAYGLTCFLLTPFRDNGHLKAEEKRFNNAHSSTRVDIERAFGLLKGKFRKLKFLDMRKIEDIPNIIISCCALHNFILQHETLDEDDIDWDEIADTDDPSESLQDGSEDRTSTSGHEKRQEIMHLLS